MPLRLKDLEQHIVSVSRLRSHQSSVLGTLQGSGSPVLVMRGTQKVAVIVDMEFWADIVDCLDHQRLEELTTTRRAA